jgi:hypothetical protein
MGDFDTRISNQAAGLIAISFWPGPWWLKITGIAATAF